MQQLLLTPNDTLFFRDGRPMEGSLAGESQAWPLPHTINGALHAALWRAYPKQDSNHEHIHRQIHGSGANRKAQDDQRSARFGSLQSIGPFPVLNDSWYLPTPADLQQPSEKKQEYSPTLLPLVGPRPTGSLPQPLLYPVANTLPPTKNATAPRWLNADAFSSYVQGEGLVKESFLEDQCIADYESQIGIAIDPATGTTGHGEAEGKIYSASYLRLKPTVRLGLLATAPVKNTSTDLIGSLIQSEGRIVVGGQQKVCTAMLHSPEHGALSALPRGFVPQGHTGTYRLKWVLLTPALFPALPNHPGGWLPNWICPQSGKLMLKQGDTSRRSGETRTQWRQRVAELPSFSTTRLVAALIHKPDIITGWGLAPDGEREGAKNTHLAVPAGSIYYFECDTLEEATATANALNWHGTCNQQIVNRRSTLCGEKGFGIGICAPWTAHPVSSNFTSNQ